MDNINIMIYNQSMDDISMIYQQMLFHSDVSLPVMGWFHRYYDRLFKEQLVPMMPEMAVQMYRKQTSVVPSGKLT